MEISIPVFYIPIIVIWLIALFLSIKMSSNHYTDPLIWFANIVIGSILTGLYYMGSYLHG